MGEQKLERRQRDRGREQEKKGHLYSLEVGMGSARSGIGNCICRRTPEMMPQGVAGAELSGMGGLKCMDWQKAQLEPKGHEAYLSN